MHKPLLGLLVIIALGSAGCGDGDDDGSSSSSSDYSCCLNGQFFDCPSGDAVSNCPSTGGASCTRDSSRDNTCN